MSIISVTRFTKTFENYRTRPGVLGTLRDFVSREKKVSPAVTDLSFTVEAGELVGFLGPNGAGKTTTLKALSGIIAPSAGDISVLGFSPFARKKAFLKQIGLVMGQKNMLTEDLSAYDSFLMLRAIYEIPKEEFERTLQELTELFEVGDIRHVPVRTLSLGERMKCELMAVLLHKPKVLFLDEPTIGLDVVAQKNMREYIRRYNTEKHITILLTSHYMEDIASLAKRVMVIHKGGKIYDGNLDALVRAYAPHKLLKLTFTAPIEQPEKTLAPFGTVRAHTQSTATLEVAREQVKEKAIALLSSTLPIDDIVIDEVEIDDVIRKMFLEQ